MSDPANEFYARTYDVSVPDWPGELDFYRAMADAAIAAGGTVLEVACGTGRITIRLAQSGANIVGLDISPEMLQVARQNSLQLSNLRWVEGDMRSFELGERFDLALIPGHAFQNLNTPNDQAACLDCIKRHLHPGGVLVVHLDHMNTENMAWLGGLCTDQAGVFEAAEQFNHPDSGRQVRASRAWTYEPATQTAVVRTVWEEFDADGKVSRRFERGPNRLHVLFRFEMEHLLARVGFQTKSVYGDFFRHELQDDSPSMVWIARRP